MTYTNHSKSDKMMKGFEKSGVKPKSSACHYLANVGINTDYNGSLSVTLDMWRL